MGICLKIIGVCKDNEQKIVYTSSDPCDGLALMLKNKIEDYRTTQKLDEILTAEEIQTIKCTFDENSVSVSEGYEKYNPEFETPNQLQVLIDKIKRFYIKKVLLDKALSDEIFREILFDIATLSELYSALDVAKTQDLKIILTLEDF
jgi:hypothetical protein